MRYTKPPEGGAGTREILQTVTLYPAKNIPAIAALAEKQERSDKNMLFTNLSPPAIGSYCQAFSGTVNPPMISESNSRNKPDPGPVGGSVQQDFIEIIFSKGDFIEVIRMTGSGADYSTLSSLAQKACNKIP